MTKKELIDLVKELVMDLAEIRSIDIAGLKNEIEDLKGEITQLKKDTHLRARDLGRGCGIWYSNSVKNAHNILTDKVTYFENEVIEKFNLMEDYLNIEVKTTSPETKYIKRTKKDE